jgi:hypothetical protein
MFIAPWYAAGWPAACCSLLQLQNPHQHVSYLGYIFSTFSKQPNTLQSARWALASGPASGGKFISDYYERQDKKTNKKKIK